MYKINKIKPFKKNIKVPADKSISHRSLLFGALANGTTIIENILEGEDVIATANALKAMGVKIEKKENKYFVEGVGLGNLKSPESVIDMGNTGTGVRLLMGVIAGNEIEVTLTGDESLVKRPMARVTNPLKEMGLEVVGDSDKDLLPLKLKGSKNLSGINYDMPVASAQVKSAILLAALHANSETNIIENKGTRDHTEKMLKAMGADITSKKEDGKIYINLKPGNKLKASNINVPTDPSSAAFFVVLTLITENSELVIENVCINEYRIGLYTTLIEMGANIEFTNKRKVAGEDVADLIVKSSKLKAVTVPASRAPSMIDEYPVLAIAALFAEGTTKMLGLEELRVKESDRFAAILDGTIACGYSIKEDGDNLYITGNQDLHNHEVPNLKAVVKTHLDHRIAMSFLILSAATGKEIYVDDIEMIKTSFPNFLNLINNL